MFRARQGGGGSATPPGDLMVEERLEPTSGSSLQPGHRGKVDCAVEHRNSTKEEAGRAARRRGFVPKASGTNAWNADRQLIGHGWRGKTEASRDRGADKAGSRKRGRRNKDKKVVNNINAKGFVMVDLGMRKLREQGGRQEKSQAAKEGRRGKTRFGTWARGDT